MSYGKKGSRHFPQCNCAKFRELLTMYQRAERRIEYLEAENNTQRVLLSEKGVDAVDDEVFRLQQEVYSLKKRENEKRIEDYLRIYKPKTLIK